MRSHMCVYIHACQGSRLMLGPYHSLPSLTMRIHGRRNSQLSSALISTASLVSQLVQGSQSLPLLDLQLGRNAHLAFVQRLGIWSLASFPCIMHFYQWAISNPCSFYIFSYTNIFIAFSVFHCVYIERLSNLTVTEIFSNTR